MRTLPPTGALTSVEAALAALLDGLAPVASRSVPLDQALGCVAAGVMGQVYMGVPCVVGGALSNVALKYLAPAQ